MGAGSYQVFRQTQGEPAFTQVGSTAGTTYTSEALTPGRSHAFYVQAVNGSPSGQAWVTSGRPVGFGANTQDYSPVVNFGWSGTDGATGFVLSRSHAPTGPWLALAASSIVQNGWAVDSNGVAQLARYYKLAVTYPTGTVDSDVKAVTVKVPLGIAPLVATKRAPGNVRIEFPCDPMAGEYRVFRAQDTGPSAPLIDRYNRAMVIQQQPQNCRYSQPQDRSRAQVYGQTAAAGATYHYRVVASYNNNTTLEGTLSVTLAP